MYKVREEVTFEMTLEEIFDYPSVKDMIDAHTAIMLQNGYTYIKMEAVKNGAAYQATYLWDES